MNRVVDLVTLIAHEFKNDPLHKYATRFINWAEDNSINLMIIESIVIEAESLYLSGGVQVPKDEWFYFIQDLLIESPDIKRVDFDREIYNEHLTLYYRTYGNKISYFDSFHGALAKTRNIPLVTSDKTLLNELEIPTQNLKDF